MSKEAGVSGGASLGVASGAAVVVAAAGAVVGGFLYMAGVLGPQSDAAPPDEATQTALDASEPQTTGSDDTASAEPDASLSDTLHPSISTFRLESDGQMLISGRSQPGWDITVLVDDTELSTFPSDDSGEFAQFLNIEISDAPRILRLSARSPDTGEVLASLEDVIIAPMDLSVAGVEPTDQGNQTTDDTTPEASEEKTRTDEGGETGTAVLISDEDGVRVLQPPVSGDPAPDVMSVVALDTITYSPDGEVQLSGRGQSEGFVQVYLDNAPITTSRIAEDGNWRSDLPEVDTGVYTLRIDEVDDQGNVTSRVETPFKREDKDVLASQEDTDGVRAITVQTGNTLWAISRERYGEGTAYVRIFEANRDRIRNPDLIFPGQVFSIPE